MIQSIAFFNLAKVASERPLTDSSRRRAFHSRPMRHGGLSGPFSAEAVKATTAEELANPGILYLPLEAPRPGRSGCNHHGFRRLPGQAQLP